MRPYHVTLSDAEAMRKLPSVREVTAAVENETIQQISSTETGGTVKGIDTYYGHIRALPMADGRLINKTISMTAATLCVGSKSAQLLFSGRPALGEWILLNGSRFQVIGVAAKTGRGQQQRGQSAGVHPALVMMEMFPIKGENLPQDALSGIQYQPRVHGDNELAVAMSPLIAHGMLRLATTRMPLTSGTRSRASRWWARYSMPWTSSSAASEWSRWRWGRWAL